MPIHSLLSSNFSVVGRPGQKAMMINVPGVMLVLFEQNGCNSCAAFKPIFAQLANAETRISYGIINVSQFRDVIVMSRDTTTPIQGTPTLILYISGRPHTRFNGAKNLNSVREFINKSLQEVPPSAGHSTYARSPEPAPTNMYGGFAAPPAAIPVGAPAQGSAGFATARTAQASNRTWQPEIGNAPSLQNMLKGSAAKSPSMDDDDEQTLMTPVTVTPYNSPWDNEYARLGNE